MPSQKRRERASMLLVITLLILLMITIANRPTLVFLTNTTSTVNAFTVIMPTSTKLTHKKSQEQTAMKLQQRNIDSSDIEEALASRVQNLRSHVVSRKTAIRSALLFGLMSYTTTSPMIASAADATTAAMTGTKQDPKYEACLSKCMYDCTKPKGTEQKSRAVCLPECKTQCATTKQQLMIGTPIK